MHVYYFFTWTKSVWPVEDLVLKAKGQSTCFKMLHYLRECALHYHVTPGGVQMYKYLNIAK